MKDMASLLTPKKKFLIFGCGFSGNYFAKKIREFGCTALTSSRSIKNDPNSFVFNSETNVPTRTMSQSLAAYRQIKMVKISIKNS